MKKITILVCILMACLWQMKAQQFVSTTPSNRNVILEEFTGRNCGYCPDGHLIANNIAANHPGRFWAVNVHGGGYSPSSYPNLNTQQGSAIMNAFHVGGFPAGVVNRSTSNAVYREQWESLSNSQFNQPSELNVGGQVVINPVTRLATVTVEVYYTGNSTENTNYLTVMMLQDSIFGSQAGGSSNPSQWVNGQYCHMHIFRDIITPLWGDEISPTTEGTLITKTYTYNIPEMIGTPNGVAVDIDNIHFIAFVTEKYQGVPTRPILSGNELTCMQGVDEPIYPYIAEVTQQSMISCSHDKTFEMRVVNGGLDELTSIKFEASVDNGTPVEYTWNGNLPSYQSFNLEMDLEVPFGTHNATFNITEANGEPFEFSKSLTVSCDEWIDVNVEGEEENLKIEIMQDKFGNQTTWKILASDMTVLASGGPYTMLVGGNSTQMHIEHVVVPANECIQFIIHDDVGNGICCTYGEGYYKVYDSKDNLLIDGDGEFGSEASHLMSIIGEVAQATCQTNEATNVTSNSATLNGTITSGNPPLAGFLLKTADSNEWVIYDAEIDGDDFSYDVTELVPGQEYVFKAFVKMSESGDMIMGEEVSFVTTFESVDENDITASYMIYPNPVKNILTIKGEGINRVIIYNAIGQAIKLIDCNSDYIDIDVNDLQKSIYFIRIINDNSEMVTKKIVLH